MSDAPLEDHSNINHDGARDVKQHFQALQLDNEYHTEQLRRKTAVQQLKSEQRTTRRLEARRKVKSSSLLRQLSAFSSLTKERFDRCVEAFEYLEYTAGATIMLQGEAANRFMVLVKGKCNVLQAKENNQDTAVQRIVGHMEAPCFFGESALLPSIEEGETPCRVASVVAANNSGITAEETEPVQILSLSQYTQTY